MMLIIDKNNNEYRQEGYTPIRTLVLYSIVPKHFAFRPKIPLPENWIHWNGQSWKVKKSAFYFFTNVAASNNFLQAK